MAWRFFFFVDKFINLDKELITDLAMKADKTLKFDKPVIDFNDKVITD